MQGGRLQIPRLRSEPVTLLIFRATFKRICHPACAGLPWNRSKAQWSDLPFLFWFSHRIVILSEAPHRLLA